MILPLYKFFVFVRDSYRSLNPVHTNAMIGEVTVTQTRQAGQPDNEKSTGIFLFSATTTSTATSSYEPARRSAS